MSVSYYKVSILCCSFMSVVELGGWLVRWIGKKRKKWKIRQSIKIWHSLIRHQTFLMKRKWRKWTRRIIPQKIKNNVFYILIYQHILPISVLLHAYVYIIKSLITEKKMFLLFLSEEGVCDNIKIQSWSWMPNYTFAFSFLQTSCQVSLIY